MRVIDLAGSARMPAASVVFAMLLAGCGTTVTGFDFAEFEVIAETAFAPSLEIDLADFTLLDSGVYIQDEVVGGGASAELGTTLDLRYTGWLSNGTEFDAGTFAFLMGSNQVIPGFEFGIVGMKVGGVRRMIIPPALAYGARGSGPVPGGAIVIFRVELDSVT